MKVFFLYYRKGRGRDKWKWWTAEAEVFTDHTESSALYVSKPQVYILKSKPYYGTLVY